MLRFGSINRFFRTRLFPIALAIFTLGLWALYNRAFPTPDTVRPDTRPRTEEGLQRFRSEEPRDALAVLLGDSITERWRNDGAQAWSSAGLKEMNIANAGVGGDRTQHVLWRLDQGLLDGMKLELVVLLIGTNNLITNTEADILLGVKAIVTRLWKLYPRLKIVLCSVPPWVPVTDFDRGASVKVAPLNALLQNFAATSANLHWWDWAADFRDADGLGKTELFKDRVHLSAAGYALWAKKLKPLIKSQLADR